MEPKELEQLERELLLEAMLRRYGYDFRHYAAASLKRRLNLALSRSGLEHLSQLIPRFLHDEVFFQKLLRDLSVTVTDMFRDPHFYQMVRRRVIPVLKTYPFVKIWHAGCATGEEAYSMAILLKEEGLAEKANLFGTDFNDSALEQAKDGIYPVDKMKEFTKNYQQAGGSASFAQYYHANYESAVMDGALKNRITFANHNLVTDEVFGEMHVIFCRNVLIYFNKELQGRALRLFTDSLIRGGFLCLGNKEDLQFSEVKNEYEVVDEKARIFRKKVV